MKQAWGRCGGMGSFSGEVLAHCAAPKGLGGLCRKSGEGPDRG